MSIPEQLRRILISAPNLPVQMVATIVLFIGMGMISFKALDGLFADWTEGTAEFIDFTDIQERTKEGEPEYFYKIHYKFMVNNHEYQVKRERGFRKSDLARKMLEEEVKIDLTPVWYSSRNPNRATLEEDETKWYFFLYALIPLILALSYLRWLFLKYYELEIQK